MPTSRISQEISNCPNHIQEVVIGYLEGYYLMAEDDSDELGWYTADSHTLIPIGQRVHVPKSLKRALNQNRFETKRSSNIEAVIDGCRNRETTWISESLKELYLDLAQYGIVQTYETWQGNRLAGGILGLTLGGAFIGESMFTAIEDAGKVALVQLCYHLHEQGFTLFDAQLPNPHLARFGSYEVSTSTYVAQLKEAFYLPCQF